MRTIQNVLVATTAWAEPQWPLTPFQHCSQELHRRTYCTCRVKSSVSEEKREYLWRHRMTAQCTRRKPKAARKCPVCLCTLKVTLLTHASTRGGGSQDGLLGYCSAQPKTARHLSCKHTKAKTAEISNKSQVKYLGKGEAKKVRSLVYNEKDLYQNTVVHSGIFLCRRM